MSKLYGLAVKLLTRYKDLVLYGIVGVFSTLLNIGLFRLFDGVLHIHYMAANALAWALGVGVVFVANKYIVFGSKKAGKGVMLYEITTFFASRLLSGVLDMAIMFVMVDLLAGGGMTAKIIDNIIVIVFNYFASKFVVFKKGGGADAMDKPMAEGANG